MVSLKARQVYDSRGRLTVEACVGGFTGIAPSGASTGSHELPEKRSNDGFVWQVEKINSLPDQDFDSLQVFDGFIESLELGSTASTALSFAAARAFAASNGIRLWEFISRLSSSKPKMPFLQFNVINGGKHAGMKNDVQEHMFVSKHASFKDRVAAGARVYTELKKLLVRKNAQATLVADEGGFAPAHLKTAEKRLDLMEKACENAGETPLFALDSAASEFYDGRNYVLSGKKLFSDKLLAYYDKLVSKYAFDSIEDGFAEDDWPAWKAMTERLGSKIAIIGDDLLVTSESRVKEAIARKACNALLVKPNQVGSVTKAIEAVRLARQNGLKIVVSHRSGETEDAFIAHLAVGLGADYAKFGAPCRSERLAKYNELLRISEHLPP